MQTSSTKPISLWPWISVRILALGIGTVVLIAFCMWLRFAVWTLWVVDSMPAPVQQEFNELRANPQLNRERYHEIVDQYFGTEFSDPSIQNADWILLFILVAIAIPLIVVVGIGSAKPLAIQFTDIATAARQVAQGNFSIRTAIASNAPQELIGLANDFNAMTQQLERYERELRQSNAAMAHELRSPLTASIGRLQGMIDGVFPADNSQLGLVMNQLKNLNRLIDDLRLLSMVNAGQLFLEKQRIDLVSIVKERIAWIKPQADAASFNIHFHVDQPAMCVADPVRVGQVVSILLENTLRYASEGKKMEIAIYNKNTVWEIHFRDYGQGVDEQFLEVIFSPFSRADESRARHLGGTGLGLTIAKAICDAHGGSIRAFNNSEAGMSFVVTIPVARN